MGGRGAQKTDGCLSRFYGTGDRKDQNREKPHKSRASGQLASGICEVSREKWCEKSHTKSPRKLTENLREIYTIIRDRDRVKDRERDKDIIIARSSNLLRSLDSKPVPEFPMKGLPDHEYLEPGEPIAIRGDRASDDEQVCDLNFVDIGALDNGTARKNKCSDSPKDMERYGTLRIFWETKNE